MLGYDASFKFVDLSSVFILQSKHYYSINNFLKSMQAGFLWCCPVIIYVI